MLTILGYALFLAIIIFAGPLVSLLLLPSGIVLKFLVTPLLPRSSMKAHVITGAVIAGLQWAAFIFLTAALVQWVFACSSGWLTGFAIASMLTGTTRSKPSSA